MNKSIFRFLFVLSLMFFSNVQGLFPHRELIDDEMAAQLITVITTTNPIPSLPNPKYLYATQASLTKIPALRKCKKIIVFDGICPGYEDRAEDYDMYKTHVASLIDTDPYFMNTELVFCDQWVHLTGTVREALKHVTTPFIFIYQHDDILAKPFDLNGCLRTMRANPSIKYIHFSHHANQGSHSGDMDTTWYGPVDSRIKGGSFVPLTRFFGWSDYAHMTTVDYYQQVVLPLCEGRHGPMEWCVHSAMKEQLKGVKEASKINQIHSFFGTYLYGDLKDGSYIFHSNGKLP